MTNAIRTRLNIMAQGGLCVPILALAVMVLMTMPTTALAGTDVTFEGVLQGVTCVHYQTKCPDYGVAEHIALEKDFVLVRPDGEHYFLPNLDRVIKARYAGKHVRVIGKLKGHGIWVDTLEVKKDSSYRKVWRWTKQRELFKGVDH
ncbi:MAG: hypothetical protein OEU26_23830 [Candidatus Tectomicrobia bacterium]|nr:hypothetical protein [Candidatus Tectomicrobia bacterium]